MKPLAYLYPDATPICTIPVQTSNINNKNCDINAKQKAHNK